MAKFALRDGERELIRTRITDARTHVAGTLVLTERRAVLLANQTKAGGLMSALFGVSVAAGEHVTNAIDRTELAGVELTDPETLKLYSNGEGYGRIWFEIKLKEAEAWLDVIHHWAEHGVVPGDLARLPVAKVVKRRD